MNTITKHDQDGNNRATRKGEDTRQLLLGMADTTWRMFVSPMVLVPLGIAGDLRYHTGPWLTILATVAGLGLSVLLVRRQLRGDQ